MILKVLFSFKLSTNWPYVSSSNWKLHERNYERLNKVHVCPRLSLSSLCCPGGKPVASHGILFLATQEIQKAVGWLFAFFFFFILWKVNNRVLPMITSSQVSPLQSVNTHRMPPGGMGPRDWTRAGLACCWNISVMRDWCFAFTFKLHSKPTSKL